MGVAGGARLDALQYVREPDGRVVGTHAHGGNARLHGALHGHGDRTVPGLAAKHRPRRSCCHRWL